jgi:hypothetical protein
VLFFNSRGLVSLSRWNKLYSRRIHDSVHEAQGMDQGRDELFRQQLLYRPTHELGAFAVFSHWYWLGRNKTEVRGQEISENT